MSLEDVREKKSSVGLYVVIGLLLVGMAGFGTSQFGSGSGGSNPAALSLGDVEISTQSFQQALNANRQRYPDLEEAMVEDMTLSQLRQRLALENYLHKYPLAASNKSIDDAIRNNPAFYENGEFSEDVFRRVINVEPQVYRSAVSKDLAMQAFQKAMTDTGIVSQAEIAPYNELQSLSRDIFVAKLAKSAFAGTADDAEISAFYDAHKADYMTDEKVNIEFIDLNPQSVADGIEVSADEIAAAAQPPRHANYYLFSDEDSAKAAFASIQAGKEMATVTADFADKIEDNGDLDNITAVVGDDSPIPQKTVDALFALEKAGDVTEPMEIDGDFYLFALAETPLGEPSEAEKAVAKKKLQAEKAVSKVATLNEQLNKAVFETQSPDLDSIAEETGLTKQATGLVGMSSGESILALPEVVAAIEAGDQSIGKLQEPITIGDRVIIYRFTEIQAPEQLALDAVKDKVRQAVIAEKTESQLAEAAEKLIEQAKTQGLQAAAQATNYPMQAFDNFNGKVSENALLDPMAALSIMQQTPLLGDKNAQQVQSIDGDTYVYVNTDVRLGDATAADEETQKRLEQSLQSGLGQMELAEFLSSISASANIKMRTGLLEAQDKQ